MERIDAWAQAAQICATISNVNRRRGSSAISPQKFMPKDLQEAVKDAERPRTLAEMKAKALRAFAPFGFVPAKAKPGTAKRKATSGNGN